MRTHKYRRGQTVFKEGDEVHYVYIVKEGEFEVKKHVYEPKTANREYDLLHNPTTSKKFTQNFAKVQGFKVQSQVTVSVWLVKP